MIGTPRAQKFGGDSIVAPLRHPTFRRIWLASVLSNLGILIQGVGAAWAMTQMASSADKVALVQTALSLPIMLIAIPAGAIADVYDRRIVAMVALCIAVSGATALAVLTWLGLVTPNLLLGLCFAVGSEDPTVEAVADRQARRPVIVSGAPGEAAMAAQRLDDFGGPHCSPPMTSTGSSGAGFLLRSSRA